MASPTLTERRRLQTRLEIAKSAEALFLRDGYDSVTAEDIAEDSGVSLRTFYRYFSSKDEVLSPIITDGMLELVGHIAARPARESLVTAVQHAVDEITPENADAGPLLTLLTGVPALRSRWLHDLRTIEEALVPVVHERARRPISDEHARLSAAAVVTGLRVVLESSVQPRSGGSLSDSLGQALRYLRDGARL
ncbi:MAG TPA: TetR family transcriptional regulator [Solirubrobacteraceae bacterium]